MLRLFYTIILMLFLNSANAASLPGIPEFINEMVAKHQFKREELVQLFQEAQHRQDVIDAISKPSTLKPWYEYRAAFINPKRIKGGVQFMSQYADALERAEKTYGVPREIIVAIIGVETLYGKQKGNYRTVDALTTLTFDYPRRVAFFRSELEEYLLLAREQNFDVMNIKASYAGALGIPQFMPSNYRKIAVDFNGNGKVDLLNEPVDAIGSVANYLKLYGWKPGEPVAVSAFIDESIKRPEDVAAARSLTDWAKLGVSPTAHSGNSLYAYLLDFTLQNGKEYWLGFNNFAVITTYNNSIFYAMSVFELAEEIKKNAKDYGLNLRAPL